LETLGDALAPIQNRLHVPRPPPPPCYALVEKNRGEVRSEKRKEKWLNVKILPLVMSCKQDITDEAI
jgi:hypothetical protein